MGVLTEPPKAGAQSTAKIVMTPHYFFNDSGLLKIARWAALFAAVGVTVVAAISEYVYSKSLTPSVGLVVTAISAVVGAAASVINILKS